MLKIEKGIPLPGKRTFGNNRKYPLRQMKVGDSFVVDNPSAPLNNLYVDAVALSMKITIRKTEDGKRRVWRVA